MIPSILGIALVAALGLILISIGLFNWLVNRQREREAADARKAAIERARLRHLASMAALGESDFWVTNSRKLP